MKTTTYFAALMLSFISPAILQAQTPQLLKDIATGTIFTGSNPSDFIRAGDNMYFFAAENGIYSNLYITDGTEAGTQAAPIDEFSSSFVGITKIPFGNNLIISGSSLSDTVYFADGTATGEVKIMDDHDYDFTYGIGATNSFVIDDEVFFWAKRTGDNLGAELYKSDGTASGTMLFNDFNVGPGKGYGGGAASSHCIQASDDKAYILASDGDSIGIYSTDGSTVQHHRNLIADAIGADVNFYTSVVNGHVFFKTLSNIWSIDISDNSSSKFSGPTNSYFVGLFHMDSKLYAISHDGSTNRDLHSSDGTTFETVADNFATASGGIYPLSYSTKQCEADGKFYFFNHPSALDPVQLWSSDGTEAGTVKVLDSIGVSGQGVDNIYACNNRTYYYQSGAVHTLFEINNSNGTLDEISDGIDYAPYMDEENCRMYFGYTDAVAQYEPHYMDFGAPVNNSINPPTNLMASTISRSTDKIGLMWEDKSNNETGFYVERGTDGTNFTQIADLGVDVTSYDDTAGLAPATQYYYRVKAYNASETSAPSNVADATTNVLSISEYDIQQIVIYPNPASSYINLESIENGKYTIFNSNGISQMSGGFNGGQTTVGVNELAAGVYFIQVKTDSHTRVIKLIKQ